MPARWSRPSDPSPSRLPRWAPLQRPLFTPVSHGLHRRFFFRNGPRPQPSRSVVAAQALEAPRAVKELPMSEKPRPAPLTFPDADRSPLSIRAKALVFFDPRSHRVREELERLAPQGQPVLIEGETGTGKELLARQIHRHSERAGLFVAVSCSALSRNHAEAELFGYAPGAHNGPVGSRAGWFGSANGGTLYLDEIGDLPLELQANLLRFLQEQQIERVGGNRPVEVDVRVLAATHVDLEAAIDAGTFREDLYYRLNVLQVGTAPLRERSEDLPLLANHFSRLYSLETGRRPRRFSEDALAAMAMHAWPGNVRELANRVRRGLVLAEGKQIEAQDLGLECARGDGPPLSSLEVYKLCAERQAMCDALARYGDNLSVAARMLGVSRPTFYRLLHKHRLR